MLGGGGQEGKESERKGGGWRVHMGISGVSSSQKYFIKEDQDPGD